MQRWLVFSFVAASTLTARASFAQLRGDTSGLSAAALAGYGADDLLKFGLGARVGYTLPGTPIYLGGTFVYHSGTSESSPLMESTGKTYYYGLEGGYHIALGLVALRPFVGLGVATTEQKMSRSSGDTSIRPLGVAETTPTVSSAEKTFTGYASIWPGLALLVSIGPVFVGADARFLHTGSVEAFAAYGMAGFKVF